MVVHACNVILGRQRQGRGYELEASLIYRVSAGTIRAMHLDSVSTNQDSAKSCRECLLHVALALVVNTHPPLWKECSLFDSVNSIPSPYIFLNVTLEWPKLPDSDKKNCFKCFFFFKQKILCYCSL